MIENNGPIRRAVVLAMMVVAASSHYLARAQFLPGRIFTVDIASAFCEHGTDEYVLEIDPEAGTTREFAFFPDCPGLSSLAMSPDGKHLRVVAFHWGAILEFDSQGNWEVVIDGSDGIFPAAEPNGITYDRDGNFYVCNYYLLNAKVLKFPANGGPPTVLAYYDNNGVTLSAPGPISVGPDGDVYVADDHKLIRIGENGVVTLFDTYYYGPFLDDVYSVLVDDHGFLSVRTGNWYRYELGDSSSREVFFACQESGEGICASQDLVLSPDRASIYTQFSRGPFIESSIIAVDSNGSYETVVVKGVGSFAVIPLRGDADGDTDTDLGDLEWVIACLTGPDAEVDSTCDLGDMDADEDVDLFDVRYFMVGHSAFAESVE